MFKHGFKKFKFKKITIEDVLECQQKWIDAIKNISNAFLNNNDYILIAKQVIDNLYAYDYNIVLFKPTKASECPFRSTKKGALSYFVGGDKVENGFVEDKGFAINSGKCWSNVEFYNHQIDINNNTAIAMGIYVFTCAKSGEKVAVEYTFGYKLNNDGNVRIFLHHSSIPYNNS